MKKIFLFCATLMLYVSAFAQENPRDSLRLRKKSPDQDTAHTKPVVKSPPEIDPINRTDSVYKRNRTNQLDRYREDSIPKMPKK